MGDGARAMAEEIGGGEGGERWNVVGERRGKV